jgi:hypothetical protein
VTPRAFARLGTAAVAAVAIASLAFAPAASADIITIPNTTTSPVYTPWSDVLPGWNDALDTGSSNDCASGRPNCLNVSLREELHVFTPLAQSCSHLAIFPLAYVRMTQTYGWTRDQAGYYRDVPYMNHMDAVFAKYYTDAYYNWTSGNTSAVPQAWQYAFGAGQAKTVTGAGDLFLGMNAHINRDLPFVLYASGLVESDHTTSGKSDYDAVEKWLYDDTAPLLAEAAQRFDPTIDDGTNPWVDYFTFQMVSAWRENAWRNAEALASAPDAQSRALVAAKIENDANNIAQGMLGAFAMNPTTQSNATRDAYCAAHNGDTAPQSFPMGTPAPWGNTVN